jgi:hypothetical protein
LISGVAAIFSALHTFIGFASEEQAEELFSAGVTHVFSSYEDCASFLAALATAA